MKPTLLIMAAGMGSRYGGLKQVDAIGPNGEALIEYSIYDAIRANFGKVVFVIRKDIEQAFKEKFANKFEDKIQIEYVFQEIDTPIEGLDEIPPRQKPWGTAHAVLVAQDVIKEPFAAINADDYYGTTAFSIMSDFLEHHCQAENQSLLGYVLPNTLSDYGSVSRGVCESEDGEYLSEINERTKVQRLNGSIYYQGTDGENYPLRDNHLVSMNFWGFHPSIFETIRNQFIDFVKVNKDNPKAEFFIPLVVDRQIKDGSSKYKLLHCDEKWYGVTYKEDKPRVQASFRVLIDQGVYPERLW